MNDCIPVKQKVILLQSHSQLEEVWLTEPLLPHTLPTLSNWILLQLYKVAVISLAPSTRLCSQILSSKPNITELVSSGTGKEASLPDSEAMLIPLSYTWVS